MTEALWRHRDFRRAWIAGFVNDTGDWVLAVGLPVFVFVETRSGATTALVFVCQLVAAAVFGPIGGGLVDRFDLRRCLILTNLAQAVTLLPLLAVDAGRVWPAYPVVVAQAMLTRINNPANVALLPRVLDTDRLVAANAGLAASASLARLCGSPLGGVLVAWGGLRPIVVVDAISFLAAAAALAGLKADTSPQTDAVEPHGGHVRGALRAVRRTSRLTLLISLHGVSQVAQGGFVVLFVAFVVEVLGDDGRSLGVIRGAMAIGALAGAALIGRVADRIDPLALYAGGLAGMGVVAAAFWNAPALTTAVWVYVVLFALSGIPGAAVSVGLVSTVQTRSPRGVLGGVTGMLGTAEAIGTAAGSIAAGVLIDHVSLRPLLNTQAGIYLATGAGAGVVLMRRRPPPVRVV